MWTTLLPIVDSEDVRSFAIRQQLVNCLTPTTLARSDGGKWTTPAWGLPAGLCRYAERYGTQLGLPHGEDWLNRHTLAPYYMSTLPRQHQAAFAKRLLDYRPGPRRPLLPIASVEWFTPIAVLCPACDDEHLAKRGFSVVLRQWLLPFATRCAVHGEPLRRHPAWTPVGRATGIPLEVKAFRHKQGRAMAQAEDQVLQAGQRSLDLLGELLQSRGFVSAAGRIRRQALCAALEGHAANRYEHPHLDALLSAQASVARVLAPLWTPRSCLHPAVAYALVQALQDTEPVAQELLWSSSADRKNKLGHLTDVLSSCATLTEAARTAGVSVTTAAVVARAMGLAFSSRPKKLDSQLVKQIEELLLSGTSVSVVAERTGLSSVTVYRVLRANRQLTDSVTRLHREQQLQARRAEWLQVAQSNLAASRKALRAIAPSAYAFLYRWDRAWLASNPERRRPENRGATARTARAPDGAKKEFLARLRQSRTVDAMQLPPRQTPTRLLKAAGRGNSTPESLSPQLKKALEAATETLQEFVSRRLSAAVARLHNNNRSLSISAIERESRLRTETIRRSGVRTELVAASTRSYNLKRRVS